MAGKTTVVTLHGVASEGPTRTAPRWVAYWTVVTKAGRFACHQVLPFATKDKTAAEASAYATAHPDPWVTKLATQRKPRAKKAKA